MLLKARLERLSCCGQRVIQFAKQGYQTVQDTEVTWRRKPFILDHIFFNAHLRCTAHRVCPTPASDHHALVADFEFVK